MPVHVIMGASVMGASVQAARAGFFAACDIPCMFTSRSTQLSKYCQQQQPHMLCPIHTFFQPFLQPKGSMHTCFSCWCECRCNPLWRRCWRLCPPPPTRCRKRCQTAWRPSCQAWQQTKPMCSLLPSASSLLPCQVLTTLTGTHEPDVLNPTKLSLCSGQGHYHYPHCYSRFSPAVWQAPLSITVSNRHSVLEGLYLSSVE